MRRNSALPIPPARCRAARAGKTLLAPIVIVALAAAASFAHRAARTRRDSFPASEDVMYLPRTSLLQRLSLGHHELLADIVFIRAVNYFGAELTGKKRYDWLDRHVETVNQLDPRFRTPYVFGAHAAMYNGLPITNEAVQRSNRFLEAGLKQFPNDWEMAFSLGCNYLNELQTTDKKQKEAWRRTGAQWIRRAAIAGGGPPWLPNLAATILTEEGDAEAALRYLEEAYLTTDSDESRAAIGNLIAARQRDLYGKLSRAQGEFTARWKRDMPYAPGDLYVLVGEAPTERMDLAELLRDPVLEADERAAAEAEAADREGKP